MEPCAAYRLVGEQARELRIRAEPAEGGGQEIGVRSQNREGRAPPIRCYGTQRGNWAF
jgi:hypothetical protein